MTDTFWPASTDSVSSPKLLHVRETNHETAYAFIEEHHYLHSTGSTSVALGLFDGVDRVAGMMTFGTIIEKNAAAICGPKWRESVFELTRLVVHGWAGKNSESFFIGQAFRWLRHNRPDIAVLISVCRFGGRSHRDHLPGDELVVHRIQHQGRVCSR